MRVGISQIAELSGVSESTVSRVINRRGGVSPETRRAVEQAMAQIGYERSGATSQLVGVMVPGLGVPFFMAAAERLTAELAQHSLRAVIAAVLPGVEQEAQYVTEFADAGAGGAVFLSASNTIEHGPTRAYDLLESRRIPYVCINGRPGGREVPTFSTDDVLSAQLAVAHLTVLGHRKIGASAGPVGTIHSDRRVQGFKAALDRAGLDSDDRWVVHQRYSFAGGQLAAEQLLDAGVTAIVAASDQMALGAYQAVRRRGLRVPDDVSVVGHDDSALMAYVDPPLTTVRQPATQLGVTAAHALVELIAGRDVPAGELLLAPELIVRSSTAPSG